MTRLLKHWMFAVALALGALTVGHVAPAEATTAIMLTVGEMTEKSDWVVLAKVTAQNTFEGADGKPYTDSTLEVSEVLHGEVSTKLLVVRQFGGTLGEMSTFIPGDAVLKIDEEAVFFLADREPESGVVFLTVLSQSKFDVVGRDEGGELLLTRDFQGLAFYDATRDTPVYHVDDVEPLTLDRLRKQISEAE